MYEVKVPLSVSKESYPVIPMSEIKYGYGVTAFKGVIVVWDEDFDTRVLTLVDRILEEKQGELVSIYEHEGCVRFVWNRIIPEKYSIDAEQIEIGFDLWTIEYSYSLIDKKEKA